MKAIIRRATVENLIRCESRHATPQRFTHLCLSGANGRQFYEHVNTAVQGVFVFGLEDWAALPGGDLSKQPNGKPLNKFVGVTDTTLQTPEDFAGRTAIELYISGWVERFLNFTDRLGKPALGLVLDDATFLDALDPAFVEFRSDTMTWGEVDARYKQDDGSPLVDLDDGIVTELSRYVEPEE